MNQIELKDEKIYQAEDVIPLNEVDLNKIIIAKQNLKFFPIKYIVNEKEKPLRIRLANTYRTINKELVDKIFVRLHGELEFEQIFAMKK